jgi:hypothetical protein
MVVVHVVETCFEIFNTMRVKEMNPLLANSHHSLFYNRFIHHHVSFTVSPAE